MSFVHDPDEWDNKETIDHERNIIMRKRCHGLPDPMYPFELEWHGQTLEFYCETEIINRHKCRGKWEFDVKVMVSMIEIPEGFPETKKTIVEALKEAIVTYNSHPRMRTRHTEVVFPKALQLELSIL